MAGYGSKAALLEAPSRPVYEFAWDVCVCVRACVWGKKGVKERLTCREKLNRFMFF